MEINWGSFLKLLKLSFYTGKKPTEGVAQPNTTTPTQGREFGEASSKPDIKQRTLAQIENWIQLILAFLMKKNEQEHKNDSIKLGMAKIQRKLGETENALKQLNSLKTSSDISVRRGVLEEVKELRLDDALKILDSMKTDPDESVKIRVIEELRERVLKISKPVSVYKDLAYSLERAKSFMEQGNSQGFINDRLSFSLHFNKDSIDKLNITEEIARLNGGTVLTKDELIEIYEDITLKLEAIERLEESRLNKSLTMLDSMKTDKHVSVRLKLIEAFGKIDLVMSRDGISTEAIRTSILNPMASDDDFYVKLRAMKWLYKRNQFSQMIASLEASNDPHRKLDAVRELRDTRRNEIDYPNREKALAIIASMKGEKDPKIKLRMAEELRERDQVKEAISILDSLKRDKDPDVRRDLIKQLEEIKRDEYFVYYGNKDLEILRSMKKDPNHELRLKVAENLHRRGAEREALLILNSMKKNKNIDVKLAAAKVLGKLMEVEQSIDIINSIHNLGSEIMKEPELGVKTLELLMDLKAQLSTPKN